MNMWTNTTHEHDNSLAYIVLKTALSQFSRSPSDLDPGELDEVKRQAKLQLKIQSCVLRSEEARDISIPDSVIDSSVNEVASRYENRDAFVEDLDRSGMDLAMFHESLKRELHVEAAMERVASRSADVSELDAKIYYHLHSEKFTKPEIREVRHILITVNQDYPENSETKALERIENVHKTLQTKPKKFKDLAMKFSECPTAMHGGLLGKVKPGVLYPELDQVAFKLGKSQISDIVRSEIGFHILKCDSITPKQSMSLNEALPKIKTFLQDKQKKNCQRNWLAQQLKKYNG